MSSRFRNPTSQDPAESPGHSPDSSRAWAMAWALGWTEMLSWGILFYAFSVMLVPMQRELGWSSGAITGAYSLALLISGAAAPWVGRRIDAHGARTLMTAGSVLGVITLIAWSQVNSIVSFYLVWLLIGLALSCTLYEPAFAAIAPWFQRHRSRAMLIITFFGGLASTVFLPLSGWLENRFGWRDALLVLAAILAIGTILPHALVLRAPSWQRDSRKSLQPISTRSLLQSVWFQRLTIAFFLQTFTTVAVTVHMIAYLVDAGVSPTTAEWTAGITGIAQTGARVLLTLFGRNVPVEAMTALMFGTQMLAITLLVLWPGGWVMWAASLLMGLGRGALTLLKPSLLLKHYDVRQFGAVNGSLAGVLTLSQAAAPVASGLAVTASGSYQAVFGVCAAISLVSALVLFTIARMPSPGLEAAA